ncbi:hypothetical protein NVS47_09165 [Dehalobacterium formicoaceticum]|uniref:Uncharacterized protein n=1 Tax=Dehalobacterium formicoaceticum TaxID=51515 RepID=A0ABT1Y467_9FIRM|nr:hypothetical protein [Dehalobacterium formicoaceticum]MCR6545674.1 hypothetical protein [Dehalobacterium formicoaceticum]
MNAMNGSILILLVLFLVIIAPGKSRDNKKRRWGRNTGKWILVTYCGVMLASVVVLYLIPDQGFLYPAKEVPYQVKEVPYQIGDQEYSNENIKSIEIIESIDIDIFQAIQENKLDQESGIYLQEEKSFAFSEEELGLTFNEYLPVIVKRKAQNDGQIDTAYYTTKSYIRGFDLSDRIKPPTIELIGEKLYVTSQLTEIKIAEVEDDPIVNQFLGQNSWEDKWNIVTNWGERALYLEIPRDVQIKEGPYELRYITE